MFNKCIIYKAKYGNTIPCFWWLYNYQYTWKYIIFTLSFSYVYPCVSVFNMWFMINSLNSVLKNHLKLIHKVWDHKRHAPVHSGGSHVSVQLLQFPLSQSFEIHKTIFILPQSTDIFTIWHLMVTVRWRTPMKVFFYQNIWLSLFFQCT